MNLNEFVETLRIYFETSKKRHGNAWLCSLRTAMRLDRADFDKLALEAHQKDLIVLSRADLKDCDDVRYLTESEVKVPGCNYTYHFLSEFL